MEISPPSSPRPPSPPSSPPSITYSPPHSPQPKGLHPNLALRNPYRDPSSPPPPEDSYYQRVADKRRKIETTRDQSILYGFDLQPTAAALLHTNDVVPLQNFINEFIQIPVKKRSDKKKLLNSLAVHYPTSLCLKLANILLLDPPFDIRNEIVLLLQVTLTETHEEDDGKIGCVMLGDIKNPLLESFKKEVQEELLLPLSETIGNVASRIYGFSIGGWLELLEYIVSCVSLSSDDDDDDSVLKQRKGLMLLADLSSDITEDNEFWNNHYYDLYVNLVVRMLNETASEDFQNLTFNALIVLMGMSQTMGEFEIGGNILLVLLGCIDRSPKEEIVLRRVYDLGDFISLDVDEVINGKEEDMFKALLRVADKEFASGELRCAAVQVIKELDEKSMEAMAQVMKEISKEDAQRTMNVSLLLMLSIIDNPRWFESDGEGWAGVGTSQSFALGRFLMKWLCFEADGSIVVPMAIEFLKTSYSDSKSWRKRHAGMILIAAFSEKQRNDIVKCFVEFENLIMKSLNDGHHRVVSAAINATKWLGESKLIPHDKYHMKFFVKLFSIVKSTHCTRVKAEAIIAIRTLAINCCLDKMASFGEEIVLVMLELLKNDQVKIQEEAVETLDSVAALIPTNFEKYHYRTMESLKVVLFHHQIKLNYLLRAKSLECMSSILSRTKNVKAKFTQVDAVNVMNMLISLEKNLSSTDFLVRNHLVRNHIVKALEQFCRLPVVDVDRHFINLMPMLIRSYTYDFNSCWDEIGRIHVLNILSHLAVRSMGMFYSHVGRVSQIFKNSLTSSCSETRMVSASGVPNLLICAYSVETNEIIKGCVPLTLVETLVDALHKETDNTVRIIMLKTLPQCIPICGSFFTTRQIKMITDEIKHILSTWVIKLTERQRAQAGSLGENEDIPDEEIIQGVKLLIIEAVETLKGGLSPFLEDILANVALLWGNDFPDSVTAIAIAIFNVIVPLFPDKLHMFHGIYTYQLLKSNDKSLHAQRETARGFGICAEFGGYNFGSIVNVAISKLHSLIEDVRSIMGEETEEGAKISDMAVSALGKICEFQSESIDDPEVYESWLNYLPLTNDVREARNVHANFSQMLQRKDVHILGPNKENLPKIIMILRAILFRSDELVTEETFGEILEFMDKHDAGF